MHFSKFEHWDFMLKGLTKKISMKRSNLNPIYHENFEFDININNINDTNMLASKSRSIQLS